MTKDDADKVGMKKPRPEGARRADKVVGASLRNLREDRGWTVKEVGDAIGCGPNHIYKHETGICSVNIYILLKYEKLYNVSLERIIHGKKKGSEKPPPPSKVRLEFDD